jgi:hypothetical protein
LGSVENPDFEQRQLAMMLAQLDAYELGTMSMNAMVSRVEDLICAAYGSEHDDKASELWSIWEDLEFDNAMDLAWGEEHPRETLPDRRQDAGVKALIESLRNVIIKRQTEGGSRTALDEMK